MALCKFFPVSATRENELDLAVKMKTGRNMSILSDKHLFGKFRINYVLGEADSEIPEADRFLMFFA